jgi:3-hydroxyisobutyrate dehydrogenase-like beta-hydroxyacid dehydrogenase
MARIAFLGLGRMGSAMAGRLIDAGHSVTVWNRSPDKAVALTAKGAAVADTPAAAAGGVDACFSMVADDRASLMVWHGNDGAMDALKPGARVIECSTLSYVHVLGLSTAAKDRGLVYIDCPVTGFPDFAAAGTLMLLVGADPADLAQTRPLLEPLCKSIRHFGPVGTGTAYKLLNNLMTATHIAALGELIAVAEKRGLDREALAGAIETGFCSSPVVQKYVRSMIDARYLDTPAFSVGMRHKDASYALDLNEIAGVSTPVGEAATDWFDIARAANFNLDEAGLIEAIRTNAKSRRNT